MKTPTKERRNLQSSSPYFSRSPSQDKVRSSECRDDEFSNSPSVSRISNSSSRVVSIEEYQLHNYDISSQLSRVCDEIYSTNEANRPTYGDSLLLNAKSEDDTDNWESEMKLLKDPVYCKLLYTYTCLFLRLLKSKPILIQGDF